MVAKAVVPRSSDGDRDGIVMRVCKVVGNGTGRKEARVMSRSYSSSFATVTVLPDRGQTLGTLRLYSHIPQ